MCVRKCMSSGQSVIFQRVYNFPYEEDGAGVFIQNHEEKGPVESDSRRVRKIARSPGNLLHCGPRCFGAILMNIQHGFVDHLQGHKAKQPPADNPARIEQSVTLLTLAKWSPVWGKTRQHEPLGRSSPASGKKVITSLWEGHHQRSPSHRSAISHQPTPASLLHCMCRE